MKPGITEPQQVILESLMETPSTVEDLKERTGYSASFIRGNISTLMVTGRIAKVDSRMPYLYHVPADSPLAIYREKIARSKLALLGEVDADNSVLNLIKQSPREHWPAIGQELKAIAEAIEMLQGEGKLIDTLEGIL